MTTPDAAARAKEKLMALAYLIHETLESWPEIEAKVRSEIAAALTQLAGEREEYQRMIDRKNAALARPCIKCGYKPKIVRARRPA